MFYLIQIIQNQALEKFSFKQFSIKFFKKIFKG